MTTVINRYILGDDKGRYITRDKNGKFSLTTDVAKAERWGDKTSADNVWYNSCCRTIKGTFFTLTIEEKICIEDKQIKREEKILKEKDNIPEVESDAPIIQEELPNQEEQMSIELIVEQQKNIMFGVEKILEALKYLNQAKKQSSIARLELCDLQHYIEFNKLSANQGYQAYKMLREKLTEVEELKKLVVIFDLLKDANITSNELLKAHEKMSSVCNDKYVPKKLLCLFDNNTCAEKEK